MQDSYMRRGNSATAEVSFRMRIKGEVFHKNWWNYKLIKTLVLKVEKSKICELAGGITLRAESSYLNERNNWGIWHESNLKGVGY